MQSPLTRFWFTFAPATALNLGCGVTAYTKQDAIALLQEKIFREKPLPTIVSCVENIDVSTLDAGHVLPNMGVVTHRGIWFPLGYE